MNHQREKNSFDYKVWYLGVLQEWAIILEDICESPNFSPQSAWGVALRKSRSLLAEKIDDTEFEIGSALRENPWWIEQ